MRRVLDGGAVADDIEQTLRELRERLQVADEAYRGKLVELRAENERLQTRLRDMTRSRNAWRGSLAWCGACWLAAYAGGFLGSPWWVTWILLVVLAVAWPVARRYALEPLWEKVRW